MRKSKPQRLDLYKKKEEKERRKKERKILMPQTTITIQIVLYICASDDNGSV